MKALAALETLARDWRAVAPSGKRCRLCALEIDAEPHAHIVDLDRRILLCACRACADLVEGARASASGATARYRVAPTRVLADPAFALGSAQWDALQIPVRLAFIFFNSREDRWVAFYPSPAGAAESALSLAGFHSLATRAPLVALMQPDVEALLVRGHGDGRFETFVVSIEVCYRLVGEVRLHWQGVHGGDRASREIDAFFAGLRARATPLLAKAGS